MILNDRERSGATPMSEAERELHSRLHEAQSRYGYYLIAAALAALAYSISYTKEQQLATFHAPIGLAMLAWAASAAAGLKVVSNWTLIQRLSLESHMIRRGGSANVSPTDADEADDMILEKTQQLNALNRKAHAWQVRLLVVGALCFVAGHFWAMTTA